MSAGESTGKENQKSQMMKQKAHMAACLLG
jgi:hypothetical protein